MDNNTNQKRRRKIRCYLHDFGKLFVDISKLAFGSLVLGTVIRWEIPHSIIFTWGLVFSAIIAIVGIFLTRTYEEK
jgi:hypothetical protein